MLSEAQGCRCRLWLMARSFEQRCSCYTSGRNSRGRSGATHAVLRPLFPDMRTACHDTIKRYFPVYCYAVFTVHLYIPWRSAPRTFSRGRRRAARTQIPASCRGCSSTKSIGYLAPHPLPARTSRLLASLSPAVVFYRMSCHVVSCHGK